MSQSLAVFANVDNLYHSGLKRYGRRLDFKLFLDHLKKEHGRIQTAIAYGIAVAEDEKIGSFRTFLRHVGWECRWATLNYNWNVAISMDVMRQLDKVDLIIFASSDPQMSPCVEYVKQQGIKSYVYGFRISDEMKSACDRYFEIREELMITGV